MTNIIKDAYGAIYEPGMMSHWWVIWGNESFLGQAREVLYEAGGMTIDYSHKELGIPFSWVYELRDTGDYGSVYY